MAIHIGRREFILTLGGAASAWLFAARAQQPAKSGALASSPEHRAQAVSGLYAGFVRGMADLGYAEGKNFVIEWRSAEEKYERIPEIAAEFVRLNVDVIVTGTAALTVLKRDVTTIPVVMAYAVDPVGNGLVASLVRPGGNMTGLAGSSDDSSPKQLELLAAVVSNISRIGLLGNPNTTTYSSVLKSTQDAAQKAGLSLVPMQARNPQEIESTLAAFAKEGVRAVMFAGDAVFFGQRQRIAELALQYRLPTMFAQREYVAAGGMMSYGENLADFFRRAAYYVDKIFKGTKPAELPIEQPTRFHLAINRKTADAIGVTIPAHLYIFADEVIE